MEPSIKEHFATVKEFCTLLRSTIAEFEKLDYSGLRVSRRFAMADYLRRLAAIGTKLERRTSQLLEHGVDTSSADEFRLSIALAELEYLVNVAENINENY